MLLPRAIAISWVRIESFLSIVFGFIFVSFDWNNRYLDESAHRTETNIKMRLEQRNFYIFRVNIIYIMI
jgi:hypothetical protein